MKTIAFISAMTVIALPGIANATYMCDRLFAEKHKISCPAGSSWDSHHHACISTGS